MQKIVTSGQKVCNKVQMQSYSRVQQVKLMLLHLTECSKLGSVFYCKIACRHWNDVKLMKLINYHLV